MVETNAAALIDDAAQYAPEAQAENQDTPIAPDVGDTGIYKPSWENPVTDITDTPGNEPTPSNIIDMFGDNQPPAQDPCLREQKRGVLGILCFQTARSGNMTTNGNFPTSRRYGKRIPISDLLLAGMYPRPSR